MKRIVDEQLMAWKDSPRRKPLVVRGARQVGKTWSIEHFGRRAYESLVKIDFEKQPSVCGLFDGDLSPAKLIDQLELVVGKRIHPGKTLLFLDEIQACPRAIMALRYFYEDMPELHVIAAGSLLEFALADIGVPVGRISFLHMYPMTFREYLIAMGNEPVADAITRDPTELTEPVHHMLLEALKRFLFVGGLPECVSTAAGGGSLLDIFAVQDDLLTAYRDDFAKYAGRSDKSCLDAVMMHLARQVGQQIKYTRLGDACSGQTNRKAFDLLCMARIVHKIQSASPAALPLGASAKPKRFKIAFLDVGLMQRLCGLPPDREMRYSDLLDIYRGQLAEQFVAQELLATHNRELFYWSREARGSQAEVDFLVVHAGRVHPVEVKSGAGGQLRSLHLALQSYPTCGDGLVLYSGTYAHRPEQRLRFLPLYYAGALGPGDRAALPFLSAWP